MPEHFGDRLREARKRRKLTMEQLGTMIGVAKTTISGYENGNREPPIAVIHKLATALHTSSDYLLGLIQFREIPIASPRPEPQDRVRANAIYWDGIELDEEDIQTIRMFMETIIEKHEQQKRKIDDLA